MDQQEQAKITAMNNDDDEIIHRFARQLILPDFDENHQMKLAQSRALVIGAGGLGSPVIQYLTAAGIGNITIIDSDKVELSNLNRQIIHPESHIGMKKALSAEIIAKKQNKHTAINSKIAHFTSENASDLCGDCDIIIDCSDNFDTRKAANSAAHAMQLPLIFGGAVRLEGQIASFRSGPDKNKNKNAPCFECLFPENPTRDLARGCSETGILGAITGIIGTMMALEAIKQILKPEAPFGDGLDGRLLLYDGRSMETTIINTKKRPDCRTCSPKPSRQ